VIDESTLSIGEVADRTGLSVHALRFYEREGLIANPVRRGPNGHRVYTEQDLRAPRVTSGRDPGRRTEVSTSAVGRADRVEPPPIRAVTFEPRPVISGSADR